jgi:hypothetical protein
MNLSIGLTASSNTLYNGRRSFYLSLTVGRRRLWLMRWDAVRSHNGVFYTERDGVMNWSAGISR